MATSQRHPHTFALISEKDENTSCVKLGCPYGQSIKSPLVLSWMRDLRHHLDCLISFGVKNLPLGTQRLAQRSSIHSLQGVLPTETRSTAYTVRNDLISDSSRTWNRDLYRQHKEPQTLDFYLLNQIGLDISS
jgi:hypothetical protein